LTIREWICRYCIAPIRRLSQRRITLIQPEALLETLRTRFVPAVVQTSIAAQSYAGATCAQLGPTLTILIVEDGDANDIDGFGPSTVFALSGRWPDITGVYVLTEHGPVAASLSTRRAVMAHVEKTYGDYPGAA
jgi:hypothetical protein